MRDRLCKPTRARSHAHPSRLRRYQLDNADFGALPGAIPVTSDEALGEPHGNHHHHHRHGHHPHGHGALPGDGQRFWQLQPQRDAARAPDKPRVPLPAPPPKELPAEYVVGPGEDDDDTCGLNKPLPRSRRPAARAAAPPSDVSYSGSESVSAAAVGAGGADDGRWYTQPPVLDDGFTKPAPEAPKAVQYAEEDGRWYKLRPKQVPADAPHVLATTPAERAEMAALAALEARDHRGRLVPPGQATPWPEQDGVWHTMDRHQVYRLQQPWEVPPERGNYDEWNVAQRGDVVAPRFYDIPERWIYMKPYDDMTGPREEEPPPPPQRAANLTNARPWEDGSRWYKIPNAGVGVRSPPWREC